MGHLLLTAKRVAGSLTNNGYQHYQHRGSDGVRVLTTYICISSLGDEMASGPIDKKTRVIRKS